MNATVTFMRVFVKLSFGRMYICIQLDSVFLSIIQRNVAVSPS